MKNRSREALIVAGLVVVVALVGLCVSYTNYRARIDYPASQLHLEENDFHVTSPRGSIVVGKESLTSLQQAFGKGKFLGMSTIYYPLGKEFRVWFTKKQDIIWIFETTDPAFSTARGIKVGDSVDKIVSAYGLSYARISIKGSSQNYYDLVYGVSAEGTITFRMTNDHLAKLVVTRQPVHNTRDHRSS